MCEKVGMFVSLYDYVYEYVQVVCSMCDCVSVCVCDLDSTQVMSS